MYSCSRGSAHGVNIYSVKIRAAISLTVFRDLGVSVSRSCERIACNAITDQADLAARPRDLTRIATRFSREIDPSGEASYAKEVISRAYRFRHSAGDYKENGKVRRKEERKKATAGQSEGERQTERRIFEKCSSADTFDGKERRAAG